MENDGILLLLKFIKARGEREREIYQITSFERSSTFDLVNFQIRIISIFLLFPECYY